MITMIMTMIRLYGKFSAKKNIALKHSIEALMMSPAVENNLSNYHSLK